MIGSKGKVHIAFGKELVISSDDPEVIAADIDTQIFQNYTLRDINFLSLERLQQDGLSLQPKLRTVIEAAEISESSRIAFEQRLQRVDPKLHQHYLRSYANPVMSFYSA
jgi:hypothetical protein